MTTLFAFHHAGGSAAALLPLRECLGDSLDVQLVELPGRGTRRGEPLHRERSTLVAQLYEELAPRTDRPYALFGHSLGAILAYELVQALLASGLRAPRMLFVAAASAPPVRTAPFTHAQSDAEILAELRELGGTPPEFFASPELMELVLPIVRADFRLCDGATPAQQPPLPCPIHAFAGRRDRVTRAQLEGWQELCARSFSLTWFDGDHFFVRSCAALVARSIHERLSAASLVQTPSELVVP